MFQAFARVIREAGKQFVVMNTAAQPRSALLRLRARNELREIAALAARHASRYAVVPLLREEPVGVARLLALAGDR